MQHAAQEVQEVLVDLECMVAHLGMVHAALEMQVVQEAHFAQQEAQEVSGSFESSPP